MKYAVISLGGKQFKVIEGETLELERQKQPLSIDVLVYHNGTDTVIGTPKLKNIIVETELVKEKKGRKVLVSRFKPKSRYDKTNGHRQPLSVIRISKIHAEGEASTEPVDLKPARVRKAPSTLAKSTATKAPAKKLKEGAK